jgi:hypothetical protein
MPLPDPHANEETVELDKLKWKLYQEAKNAVVLWTEELNRRRAVILKDMGDAFAATVDGEKVAYHRPKDQYAINRLVKDHPDLAAHFFKPKLKEEFQTEAFAKAHPEIAEQYRVRPFVDAK